jgi:hypothetical protein
LVSSNSSNISSEGSPRWAMGDLRQAWRRTLLSSHYGAGRDNIGWRRMDALPSLYGAVRQLCKYTVTGYNWFWAATLYQKHPDRNYKLWNIVSSERYILHMQVLLECCSIQMESSRKESSIFN